MVIGQRGYPLCCRAATSLSLRKNLGSFCANQLAQYPDTLRISARHVAMRDPGFGARGVGSAHQRDLVAGKEIIEVHNELPATVSGSTLVSQSGAPTDRLPRDALYIGIVSLKRKGAARAEAIGVVRQVGCSLVNSAVAKARGWVAIATCRACLGRRPHREAKAKCRYQLTDMRPVGASQRERRPRPCADVDQPGISPARAPRQGFPQARTT